MAVDLTSYIFPIIEYDPTEKPRGIVTADEWNTIMNLLRAAANYTGNALQEIVADLYTASQLSSTELGNDGSRLIGVDVIPGVTGDNVNAVLRNLKEQLDTVVLGSIPDGSITSEKLAPDLNFTGAKVTFNNINILTESNITRNINASSTHQQVPSALETYEELNKKQNVISIGTSAPSANTSGNIYLQYIA